MNLVLCTWNPTKWTISDREWANQIRQIRDCGFLYGTWSIGGSTKLIKPGDTAFLLRQGSERGIVASGTVTSEPFSEPTWKDDGQTESTANYVEITWTAQLPINNRLTLERLKAELPEVNWSPYSSGTTVNPVFHQKLLDLWSETLQKAGVVEVKPTHRMTASTQLLDQQKGHCQICGIHPETMYQVAAELILCETLLPGTSNPILTCANCHAFSKLIPIGRNADELQARLNLHF